MTMSSIRSYNEAVVASTDVRRSAPKGAISGRINEPAWPSYGRSFGI